MAVILAGILWGMISLFIRPLSAAGFDSMQIAALRMAVAAPVFICVTAIRCPQKLRVRPGDLWMFFGTGVLSVALFNFCYFYTIIHSEASVAVVLLYTSPVFILLLSALLFHEKITLRKLIALSLTFGGCVCVAGIGSGVRLPAAAVLTGIGAGLFYGLYTIFGRVALRRYDTVSVTAYTFVFGLLGTLPFSRPAETARLLLDNPRTLLLGLGIGICCTVLPYFFYTWGLQRMESGKAAILVAVEPMVGSLVGMFVFHESRGALKLIGMAAILAAILLLNLPQKSKSGT